ncbi:MULTISPECIES: hypothetical protein [unclassified Shewanella]|uniref:hypothetical protein n=1 Tax=unclassified Shewanella TaxID=196818 RepID=UPI0015660D0E|nr:MULTISPECIES: hypothetical protein [unclassified Shewanella]NRD31561.1 hypothetical protein [Shewanella sp. DC2-4]
MDLGVNQLLQNEGVGLVPSYAPIVGRALEHEYQHQSIECHDLFGDDLLIPNFDALSWDQIIELRGDKYIEAFRSMVFETVIDNPTSVDKALVSQVQKDLWDLASEVKPSITKTFLTGFLGNLPSPLILNPIGIGAAINDTYQAKQRADRYGHVFFIQGIRGKES